MTTVITIKGSMAKQLILTAESTGSRTVMTHVDGGLFTESWILLKPDTTPSGTVGTLIDLTGRTRTLSY